MASESHTVISPSTRQGTLPVGENARNASGFAAPPKGTSVSWNAISSVRISTHGRSDQEE